MSCPINSVKMATCKAQDSMQGTNRLMGAALKISDTAKIVMEMDARNILEMD